MSFNRLTDRAVLGEKLHVSNDSPTHLRDAYQNHPFVIAVDFIAYDLGPRQRSVTVKDLLRGRCICINRPVEYGVFGDETNGLLINPLPKRDVFVHDVRLELRFQLEIENLELSLCLESDDFLTGMHDRTVGADGSTHN